MSDRQRTQAARRAPVEDDRRRAATYARDLEIARRIAAGESVRAVARSAGVSHGTVQTAMARLHRASPQPEGNPERFRAMAEAWGCRAVAAIQRGDDGDGAYWAARRAAAWAGLFLRCCAPAAASATPNSDLTARLSR